ncbi:unnamed protein product [Penicillium salamii]|uniref:Uncharacterized protein n=1 Tax=Penicillium salamii TaxID=1612424 RepID=A0A9W4JXU5_9EURO|nr:unnamed protein product [Penicillium salamii]CAG7952564.1 unnamed protein product [Penicillium salamii]CAG8004241.1 unnamed protein product [Penicillium salamii]CAG8047591.1 unnamed protein product [Penicillium salamii]CAG8130667.1 unnamed protein product [Penicillium salamii]
MPVTRSQSKILASQDPSPAQENGISRCLEREQDMTRSFVEWLDLDYSHNSILKQTDTDWKLILKKVREADGCRQITWTIPMENDQRLWLIIHWRRRSQREEFRQSDAMTQTIKEVIFLPDPGSPDNFRSSLNDKAILIYQYMSTLWKFIMDCFSKPSRPDMIYEVWTVYFPAEDIVAILESNLHYRFPRVRNPGFLPDETEDPLGAILFQIIALVSGEVEYKGRSCKRIAWFMNWKSTGEEKIFKEKVRFRKNREEKPTVMDIFIKELQGLGMLGYESCHAKFEEIRKYT